MIIFSPQYGVIPLTKTNAGDLLPPVLPGSEIFYCKEQFGTITLQEYRNDHYTIRLGIFNLMNNISLLIHENTFLFKAAFALNKDFSIRKGRSLKLKLKKGQYTFCNTKGKDVLLHLEKPEHYQVFESSFSEKHLTNYFEAFPSLKKYIDDLNSAVTEKKIGPSGLISPETKKIINDILTCPYDEALRKLYFDNKVNDLLFEILLQSFSPSQLTTLTPRQTEAIFKTREIILKDVATHYSIKELAASVGLSQVNLKSGFKQTFGTGLFEYLVTVRMEKAWQLVTQTDMPIKNIAAEIGFEYAANFITAFRKRYGQTPKELRKK